MKGVFCLVVLAFFIAVVKADADSCIANPPTIGFGGNCQDPDTGVLLCQLGSYCSDTGVCTANPTAGSPCYSLKIGRIPCALGSTCQGDDNQPSTLTCIQNTFAGDGCSGNPNSFVPLCGHPLGCQINRCVGASVGDSCYADSDCISDSCVNLRCAPIADGKNCSDQAGFQAPYECTPGLSYCALSSTVGVNGTCKAKQTSGSCTDNNQCKYGYECLRTSTTDATKQSCVQFGSIAAGQPCFDDGHSCESKRCVYRGGLDWGYCATSRVQYCNLNPHINQCAYDEVCACNSQAYDTNENNSGLNYGTCSPNPCVGASDDLYSCIDTKCGTASFYNGSCAYMNCYNQYQKAYYTCASASGLSTSILLASVMALAVSFFSKKF